jgi:hypothetical protein
MKWGLNAPTGRNLFRVHPPLCGTAEFRQAGDGNYRFCKTEPDAQTMGTCEADATTGVIEDENVRRGGPVVQLDYNKLYMEARRRFYNDQDGEAGLSLGDSARAAVAAGLLPPDTEIWRVQMNALSILAALDQGPIITGHTCHKGWLPQNLDKYTGAVDETFWDSAYDQLNNGLGGHATKCLASNIHEGKDLFVHRNSWGAIGQGLQGIICMSEGHSLATMLDNPVRLVWGPLWATWEIPAEWIVKAL